MFHAPVEFLAAHSARILKAQLLSPRSQKKISGILSLKDENFETLWAKLEDFCEEHSGDESLKDTDFIHECILRLLSRFRESAAERVLQEIVKDPYSTGEESEDDPDWWMELFAIQLAGTLRLEEAVPLILAKYHDDYDYRNDICTQALIAINSDNVVDSICRRFRAAPGFFRQYISEVFEQIHSVRSAEVCLDLIDREPNKIVRTELAIALLSHFSYEGLERVYEQVKKGDWDSEWCDLKEDFAWTCLLMGKKYPESESWEKHARGQFNKREQQLKRVEHLFPSFSDQDDRPAGENRPQPRLPGDLRSLEKSIFDIQRALKENKVQTKEEAEGVLKRVIRKVIPSFAPRDSLEASQELAYKAFGTNDSQKKIELAHEALKLSENCADAYVILGEESKNWDESIRWYRKGVEAGERSLGSEFFEENAGHFWGILETRPYMRARFNLANALWYDNRKKESLDHCRELLRLNPNDNQGVRFTLVSRLLELRRYPELKDFIENKYPESVTADWFYTKALMYFELEGDTTRSKASLKEAIESNKHVPHYLLGIKEIPDETTQTVRIGGEDEAIYYCQENAELWWRNDKAMKWLERKAIAGETYRSENKVGRNDPCPCRSGKKYKKCCAV